MDSIDIIDSAFSLDNGAIEPTDYTTFIYLGIGIIVLFLGMFLYKKYYIAITTDASLDDTTLDCEGGFCNMGSKEQ